MRQKIIFFFFLLTFVGCVTDITSDIPQAPIKPVIMGILHPQQNISVGVYKSRGLFDTDKNVFILNAKVELWRNDTFVGLAILDSAKQYSAPMRPKPNEQWTIKVFTGFGNATATTVLPNIVPITSAAFYSKKDLILENFGNFNTNYEIALKFKDDATAQNFYFVSNGLVDATNTTYYPLVSLSNDPIILSESRRRMYEIPNASWSGMGLSYIFSDALFNGRDNNMKFSVVVEQYNDSVQSLNLRMKLHHCNTEFYKFYKSANITNLYTKPDLLPIFFGDAENRYSNVEGGYGIWAAYSTDSVMAVLR